MTDDPDVGRSNTSDESEDEGALAWLTSRVGLVVLVVLGAIIGLRLMSSWLKWLLIAVVVGAVFYLIKSRASGHSSHDQD